MNIRPTVLFSILILAMSSCGKDEIICDNPQNPLCPNFDPCAGFDPPNAVISIYNILEGPMCPGIDPFRRNIQEDTIVSGQTLQFESAAENGEHHWDIGDGFITTTGDFIGNIGLNATGGGNVRVQMIEEVIDQDMCLDPAERRDTSFRNLYLRVWDRTEVGAPPIIGTFEGIENGSPDDIFSIVIPIPAEDQEPEQFLSFPTNTCDTLALFYDISYRDAIFYTPEGACKTICGFAHVSSNNNEIVLNYMEEAENGEMVPKVFFGERK